MRFESDPPGVDARTSIGYACSTPCTITLPGNRAFEVVFSKQGYRSQTTEVNFRMPDGSAPPPRSDGYFSRFSFTPTNPATGEPLQMTPNPVIVKLEPAEKADGSPQAGTPPRLGQRR